MARRARDDWLVLGLARLAEAGPRAIRLEAICAAAGATRGSFYHHFADHAEFVAALLDYWRDLADPETLDFVEELAEAPPLSSLAALLEPGVEAAIRRLAAVDDAAAAALAEIDAARLDWLAERYEAEGAMAPEARAEAAYAAYVGLQSLSLPADEDRLARLDAMFSAL